MKKALWIIGIIVICVFLLRDFLIKKMIVSVGEKMTGTTITLEHFSMSLIKQSFSLKGLKVYQPQGFTKQVMLNIPLVAVKWHMMEMLKGNGFHFALIELDIKELYVVKKATGELNVNALQIVKDQQGKNPLSLLKGGPAPSMKFDLVRLNIGKVISIELDSNQAVSKTKEMNIYLKNKEFKQVDSLQSLSALVMVEALGATFLKNTVINIKGISPKAASEVFNTIGSFLK